MRKNTATDAMREGAYWAFYCVGAVYAAALMTFGPSVSLTCLAAATLTTMVYSLCAGSTYSTIGVIDTTVRYRTTHPSGEHEDTYGNLCLRAAFNSLAMAAVIGAGAVTICSLLGPW